MAENYTYKPLDSTQNEIRLLRIESREFCANSGRHGEILCSLGHFPLLSVDNEYFALSYAWGSRRNLKTITVIADQVEYSLQIQENLHTALLSFQDETLSVVIWADAIAINQVDDLERNSQVQMMKDIYQRAEAVLVWLVPAADDSDMLFKRLRELSKTYPPDIPPEGWLKLIQQVKTESHELATFPAEPMIALLARPYFQRTWVVQEVSLAKRVWFRCGTEWLDEPTMYISANLFYAIRDLARRKRQMLRTQYEEKLVQESRGRAISILMKLPSVGGRRFRTLKGFFAEFFLSRITAYTLKVSDPRDLVFALLGIATDTDSLGLKADYTKSVQEVFTETAGPSSAQGI